MQYANYALTMPWSVKTLLWCLLGDLARSATRSLNQDKVSNLIRP